MLPPLWIFTEGDRQRGLGHLTRCSAYAAAWEMQGGEVHWVVDGDETARQWLSVELVCWQGWQSQLPTLNFYGVAIVDSYTAELETLQMIAAAFDRVIYVDDLERRFYPKGLVVHGAPGVGPTMPGEARWVYGPAWQPLRPAFWEVPQRHTVPEDVARLLIMMGSTDPRGLLPRMTEVARRVFPAAEVHAVLGHSGTAPQGCIVYRQLDAPAMRELMLSVDLAVSAAGQTSYELARCGVPGVLVGVADNQTKQLCEWPLTGAFISAGWWYEPELAAQVGAGLRQLSSAAVRLAAANAGQKCSDGQGVMRALAWLMREYA